jgi:hypothetical protein
MFVIFNYIEISFCHDSGKFVDLGQKVNNINWLLFKSINKINTIVEIQCFVIDFQL